MGLNKRPRAIKRVANGSDVHAKLASFGAMHGVLLIYSCSGLFSKNAAGHPFPSLEFFGLYLGMIVTLGLYAIGWQQVLKRVPLSIAFANKAVTVIWGMVLGVLVYGEVVTWQKAIGAAIVFIGVILFSKENGRGNNERVAQAGEAGDDDA